MPELQMKARSMKEHYPSFSTGRIQPSGELHAQVAKLQEENLLLRQQNKLLQRISEEQDEFLQMVAHDLKNPLTTIMLGASFLQHRWRELSLKDVISKLRKMQDSATHMKEMINRLLTTSVVESGKFDVVLEPIDMVHPIASIVHEYRSRAAEKGIIIHFNTFVSDTQTLSNAGMLREIVENLLSNAIKYSPADKEISVSIVGGLCSAYSEHLFDDREECTYPAQMTYNFARIEIQDEGPGLTQDDQKRLFKKFTRLSARPTAGEDSTGLGLFIVKKLVETLNGHIWCKSELGKGSTFIVEFPIISSIVV